MISGRDAVMFSAARTAPGRTRPPRSTARVRPGTLVDEAGTGRVTADLAVPYGVIARDDVAAVLDAVLQRPDLHRVIVELTAGDTPAETAVARLVTTYAPTQR